MARKPKKQRKAPSAPPPRGNTDRDKAIDALMALLAEHSFDEIGLAEVAGRAGLKLSALRAEFGSTLAIVAAHIKDIDRAVLAGGSGDMAEEPARERLFDVLMRRLEALAPYKEAVHSLLRSARRHPGLALALNAMAVRSQQWMLEAAGIGASGAKGALRAQGAALMFARVLSVWFDDDEAGPRPHHGRARPRAGERRALGRLPRRSLLDPEMHRARAAPPPPSSRRGRGGGGLDRSCQADAARPFRARQASERRKDDRGRRRHERNACRAAENIFKILGCVHEVV